MFFEVLFINFNIKNNPHIRLFFLIVVWVTRIYAFVKTHQMVHLRFVFFGQDLWVSGGLLLSTPKGLERDFTKLVKTDCVLTMCQALF